LLTQGVAAARNRDRGAELGGDPQILFGQVDSTDGAMTQCPQRRDSRQSDTPAPMTTTGSSGSDKSTFRTAAKAVRPEHANVAAQLGSRPAISTRYISSGTRT